MKFVLISIAVILVILGIYTYSNQTTEKSSPSPSISEKKKEVKKTEKVSVVAQEVEEKKSSAKNITEKSPKVISQEISQEMEDEETIAKDITQEDIDNAESDEEKERMISLAAYRETSSRERVTNLSEEDFLKILKNHFDNSTK